MRRVYLVESTRFKMPAETRAPLLPGLPRGDGRRAYVPTKARAHQLARLDRQAGGRPEITVLRPLPASSRTWGLVPVPGAGWSPWLRACLQTLGIGVQHCAEWISYSPRTVLHWLKGDVLPPQKVRARVERSLRSLSLHAGLTLPEPRAEPL